MFDLEKAIAEWRRQMTADGINHPDVLDELDSHLRERIERLSSSVTGQEAFQIAVTELGESRRLKREFARAGRFSLWDWRQNPASLNIVAACFILMGLNAVSQIISLAIVTGPFVSVWTLVVAAVCLMFSCQMAVGIGLLRRVNLCRYWAFGFAALASLSRVGTLIQTFQDPAAPAGTAYYTYFCVLIPTSFQWVTASVSIGMSLFAIYVLSRSDIRDLFTPKQSLHHA